MLRPVPTGPISRRPTPIVGRFPSADSRGFKILNMFDRASRQTITESVAESADSAVESADYWSRPTGNWPCGYGPLLTVGTNAVNHLTLVIAYGNLVPRWPLYYDPYVLKGKSTF